MIRFARTHVACLFLSAVAVAAGSFACSTTGSERVRGAKAAAESNELDRNDILDDVSMTDATSMTAADVQAFLERTPYGVRSVLAGYQPKGKLASRIIVETAKEYEINPMLLLVRAQLVHNLVSRKTASDHELGRAFGCGCGDSDSGAAGAEAKDAGAKATDAGGAGAKTTDSGSTCSREHEGFENQARCAASTLRRAMDALAGPAKATRSGWAKGQPKKTRDGLVVTPKNDATAALYGYLPWVGKLGGGKSDVGGNSAHWRLWNDFEEARTGGKNARGGSAGDASTGADAEGLEGDERDDGGVSEPGCRVVGSDDPCPNGSRCDRSDGLTGTCVPSTCACGAGMFCDSTANPPACVECTTRDTTNCLAETVGDRCVEGKCGCVTSADCGFDRRRICDPTRGICMDDPFPPREPAPGVEDAGGSPPVSDVPGSGASPAPPPTLPDDYASSSSSSSSSGSSGSSGSSSDDNSEETLEVPKTESAGCAIGVAGGAGSGTSFGAALVAAAAAVARYRRRRATGAAR